MPENFRDQVREELVLTIDENNLLNEWKGQAALMLEYSIQLADAMQEEDEAKARLGMVTAKLDRSIRAEPEQFGLAKATETVVANAINGHKSYVGALEELNEARYRARVLRGAVDAIAHRKASLQGMTDLWLRQWYADPKSSEQPAELREAANGPPTQPPARRIQRRTRQRSTKE